MIELKYVCKRACSLVVITVSVVLKSWVGLLVRANFLEFNSIVLSVVGNVHVDSKATVVTSSILRIYWLSLGRCYNMSRVCVRVFIEGEYACIVNV